MKLTPVKRIPDNIPRRTHKCLDFILDEFSQSKADIARVDFDNSDYESADVCRAAIYNAIFYRNLPYKVMKRNGEVYIVKPKILRMSEGK